MTAPSWPRLAARLLAPQVSTVQGRWRTLTAAGTFAHRSPDRWATLGEDGRPSSGFDVRHTLQPQFERGDYCTAAGPVTPVVHDGRPAWRVELAPPPHKRGLLALTVDAATGLLVVQENTSGDGHLVVLSDLVVDGPLDDAVFALRSDRDVDAARYELAHRRPVPTPQWFPWRRGWSESPELRVVETDRGEGCVGRAPLGTPAPTADWLAEQQVHRLDHAGWSWAVCSHPPMTREQAQRVVEQVVPVAADTRPGRRGGARGSS